MSYRLIGKERRIYVKEDSEEALRGLEKLIFDFDGVLVQTSQSYRQTIRKVVDYYFLDLLGFTDEKGKLATLRDIQKFKDTGLYNNDWNLSCAFVTYYLTLILKELEQKGALKDFTDQFSDLQFMNLESFIKSLKAVSGYLKRYEVNKTDLADLKDNGIITLDLFLAQAKLEKPKPTETSLVGVDPEIAKDEQKLIRKLVPYDLEKPDLLKRLFEEIYLGKELFTQIYQVPAFFNFDENFIDKENFIPSKPTMDMLRSQFGTFGIYSGRPRPQGVYILKKYDYTSYFSEKGSVFLGDLLTSEAEMETLGKPDPTLFIDLITKTLDKQTVAYVGDGIADALMVEKARAKGFEKLLFLGVVSSSEDSNKLFTEYSKHGVDAVVTDVNDIPYMLKNLEGSV